MYRSSTSLQQPLIIFQPSHKTITKQPPPNLLCSVSKKKRYNKQREAAVTLSQIIIKRVHHDTHYIQIINQY